MAAEQRPPLDLATPTRIHVVGVGGAGMSAIALALRQMGHGVSGSDLRTSPVVERLRRAGIEVAVGHDAANVGDAAVLTASPAVAQTNPEVIAAHERGLRVVSRAEMMGAMAATKRTLAIAGTHGKTTTASMLALIVLAADASPSFLIGADLSGVGANAHWGTGELLVVEADESYGSFAELTPAICGITNIEPDHLDHYGTIEDLEAAFEALLMRSTEATVVLGDDVRASAVGATCGAVRVGQASDCDVVIGEVEIGRSQSSFTLDVDGEHLALRVGAPGLHNVQNAAIAATVAMRAGIDAASIAEGLGRFAGVPRRYEFRGEAGSVTFVDDYAHLPAEVAATLDAASRGGFDRIVAVFQPHRYTRTLAVAEGFAHAFDKATIVVVTDVYSAGEAPILGVSGQLVADAVAGAPGAPELHYVPDGQELVDVVDSLLAPGDLCLTLGAGDLTLLPDQLLERRR